uniref:Uncharacterized protein n=1 Tax=Siphoviridae sp. ctnPP24 TaxID=2825662 RepID=A0A8S5TYR8_9CAUD|nr:MAG TPA: hypothetical protein [Siphoviridae sp. ctnPP24]
MGRFYTIRYLIVKIFSSKNTTFTQKTERLKRVLTALRPMPLGS